jgi:hypothetical protein
MTGTPCDVPVPRNVTFKRVLNLYFGLRKVFVKLPVFFGKSDGVQYRDFQDIQQRIDLAFGSEELVDNHDLLLPKEAIP